MTGVNKPATVEAVGAVGIPASHRDLLERPICGVLTTLGPTGQPESSLVWVDTDGDSARVNTTLERRKGRNTARFIQIRGTAVLVHDGAVEHLDALTLAYTGRPSYYGGIYPEAQRLRETRVIVRIRASRITLDAIHA